MKSKANFKSHPVHPMLIPFPIAFFCSSFLFHLTGILLQKEILWTMGKYLSVLGIATALMAAVPGAIDYFYTIPPDSSAKKRGTKHALVNLSVVILFALAHLIDSGTHKISAWIIVGIEAVAVGLLTIGGWLGGTLAFRNQIGVDHRYAGAGKWNEKYVHFQPGQRVEVAKTDELKADQMKLVHLNGKRIVIARTEKSFVAFDDFCSHKGGSLAGGTMICGTVQCPWHGSQFDVISGVVRGGPATKNIETYPLQEESGNIYISL